MSFGVACFLRDGHPDSLASRILCFFSSARFDRRSNRRNATNQHGLPAQAERHTMNLHPSDPRYRQIQADAARHAAPGYWDESEASADAAPRRASSTAMDLGDKVADIIEARMGKAPSSGYAPAHSIATHRATTTQQTSGLGGRTADGRDMGDAVCDVLFGVSQW
jgi:hypothetical protein